MYAQGQASAGLGIEVEIEAVVCMGCSDINIALALNPANTIDYRPARILRYNMVVTKYTSRPEKVFLE